MPLIEFDAYITPDGVIYPLDNMKDRALLFGVGGQGMPPIEYLMERGPHQHGETIRDYRLQPRVMQMVYRKNGNSRQGHWDNRFDLLDVMRPNRQTSRGRPAPGKLRKVLPNGAIRDIDVFIQQGPDFEQSGEWDEWSFETVMRLIAPEPTFYAPQVVEIEVTPEAESELGYPAGYPVAYGEGGAFDQTFNLTYSGTWDAHPVIYLTGPLTEVIIENLTTDEKLEFTYNIPAGRIVTVDLRYLHKTIINDLGVKLGTGVLTSDSDFGTFHLATHPEAPNGVNQIRIAGEGTIAVSQVQFSYHTRFIGI
jgi:hypothetical protein